MKLVVALTVIASLVLSGAAMAATWDLATDFPLSTGPNGPNGSIYLPAANGQWSYGLGLNAVVSGINDPNPPNALIGLIDVQYTYAQFNGAEWTYWGIVNDGCYYYGGFQESPPFIGANRGNAFGDADAPIGSIFGHSQSNGTRPTVFRWYAPYAGVFDVVAKGWIGYKTQGDAASRDFWFGVRKGNADGQETPAFFKHVTWVGTVGVDLQSDNKTVGSGTFALAAGDYLEYFELHAGVGGVAGYDFTITEVPEPGSMLALGSGIFGLLGFAWRKRG